MNNIEIEYKFLVNLSFWQNVVPEKSEEIIQAYLTNDEKKVIRVRILGKKGFITIKSFLKGATRREYEYEIPYEDAKEMIQLYGEHTVEKIRHYVPYKGKLWEVDEFKGANQGLWVAEIEVESESEIFEKPNWAGQDVTADHRYTNANLSFHPFSTWGK